MANPVNVQGPNPEDVQKLLTNLKDFSGLLQVSDSLIRNVIESVTYNLQSQTLIIKMKDLLEKEVNQIERNRLTSDPTAEEELRRLSERYKESYPQFLESFKKWKPKRKELIRTSKASADKIDLNSSMVSAMRIITSTANIIGTLQRFRSGNSSWHLFAFENASYIGMISLFLEMTLSKQYHKKVMMMLREDQERFQEVRKWFRQAKELDRAVRTFFPYGIDKDLVRRINNASSETLYDKLFISIVASNVRNDVNLFKSRIFLDKAEKFSTSEVGKQWYRKVILEDDPLLHDSINQHLSNEISSIMKDSEQNPDILIEASTLLATQAKIKLLLSGITIMSAVGNLWNDTKTEDSYALRELATKAQEELNAIEKVLELLRPEGVDIGSALQ